MSRQKQDSDVYRQLGFTAVEAENLRIRSAMMNRLIDHIEQNEISPSRAAKLFGVSRSSVSELMSGKIDLFSADSLINMLAAAGMRVEMRIHRAA